MSTISLSILPKPLIWKIDDFLPIREHRLYFLLVNKVLQKNLLEKPLHHPKIRAPLSLKLDHLLYTTFRTTINSPTSSTPTFKPKKPLSPASPSKKPLAIILVKDTHLKIASYLKIKDIILYGKTCRNISCYLMGIEYRKGMNINKDGLRFSIDIVLLNPAFYHAKRAHDQETDAQIDIPHDDLQLSITTFLPHAFNGARLAYDQETDKIGCCIIA